MARTRKTEGGSRRSRRGANKTKRSVDFSQASAEFEGDMEYAIEVKEAEWGEGDKGDYIKVVFTGADEEYAGTTVYHNASMSPGAMGRTKNMLVALGAIEEDAEEVEIDTDELVGLKCMGHTYFEKDQNGTPRIRFNDFWPLDEDDAGDKKSSSKKGGKKEEAEDIDYDELSDADIKKLAKALKIKGRDADKLREELADEDQDEVREAAEELDIELGGAGEEEEDKSSKKGRGKKDEDEDDAKGKRGRSSRGSKKSKDKQTWSEEDVQEMSEEELETVIEDSGIDVDLDDHKTLRKKKNAVIDALTEAELLAD